MDEVSGGCLCGAVRFEARGAPKRIGLCHCEDCRRHHGALFGGVAIYDQRDVTVTGPTRTYVDRVFCPVCGSSLCSTTGTEIELHLGALDAPEQFRPSYELWTERRPGWLPAIPGTVGYRRNRD